MPDFSKDLATEGGYQNSTRKDPLGNKKLLVSGIKLTVIEVVVDFSLVVDLEVDIGIDAGEDRDGWSELEDTWDVKGSSTLLGDYWPLNTLIVTNNVAVDSDLAVDINVSTCTQCKRIVKRLY